MNQLYQNQVSDPRWRARRRQALLCLEKELEPTKEDWFASALVALSLLLLL